MSDTASLMQRAVAEHQAGRLDEAGRLYREILAAEPGHALAHHNLGALAVEAGEPGAAIEHFAAALEADPSRGQFWVSAIDALHRAGADDEARRTLDLARSQGLEGAEVDALALRIEGGGNPAAGLAAEALRLHQAGRLAEAEALYAEALALDPAQPPLLCNLGGILHNTGRFAEAEEAYRRAIALQPELAAAHLDLGNTLKALGRLADAVAAYENAARLGLVEARVKAALAMPAIMGTRGELAASRAAFEAGLERLIAEHVRLDDPLHQIGETGFYLAYHGANERALQQRLAAFYEQACPSLREAAPHCGRPRRAGAPLRVGIFSRFLYRHSVSASFARIVEALAADPGCELHLLSNEAIDAALYPAAAARQLRVPFDLAGARRAIAALELDALVYLDIGMEPLGYFLAFARLAPLQCVLAGHPVTTGIPNVDCFVSAAPLEPPDAEAHYSERLVRLARPPARFARPAAPARPLTRADLGLPGSMRLYVCPTKLQKIHPDFDEALAAILALDPEGLVVLFEDDVAPWWRPDLERRFATTIPAALRGRIRFLPWQRDPAGFFAAVATADVLLDPFHFGLGSTVAMIAATGTPLVTLPGEFMRGRVGAYCCRLLGVEECIAADRDAYAALAVAVARDPARRERLAATIRERSDALYDAPGAAEELAAVLHRLRPADAAAAPAATLHSGGAAANERALAALLQQGRTAEAEALARALTRRHPGRGLGWKVLGALLQHAGRHAEALPAMRRAAELQPRDAEAQKNLGITLSGLGRPAEAEKAFRRALGLDPEDIQSLGNLGVALQAQGRLDEAEASYRRALRRDPGYARVHNNLGTLLRECGRYDESAASYAEAVRLQPGFAEAWSNLGLTQQDLGRLAEAEASLRRALQLEAGAAPAHSRLGAVLQRRGRSGEAEACFRRALELDAADFDAHCNLGVVLKETGRVAAAIDSLEAALRLRPDNVDAINNLGSALMVQGRVAEAEATLRRGLRLAPESVPLHGNLAAALNHLARGDEAIAAYRRALELDPASALAHSNLLFCLTHADVDGPDLLAEHLRYAERFEAPRRAGWAPPDNDHDPERRLRIGLVSADLRDHAIAYFLEPLLPSLAAEPGLELVAFSASGVSNAASERLRPSFAAWHAVAGLDDDALADLVRRERIDILIDLSGHTAGNRLPAFARKPAPLQASWMGYPATTGLQAIDYYFGDALFLPPGRFDGQFVERIVRLPANAPFLPAAAAPPVAALPAARTGRVNFGSFNQLNKLRPQVVAAWARLLDAVPGSRMLVGGMHEGSEHGILAGWFAAQGIAPERIDFHPRCAMADYLALHAQVDFCLDCFPYAGATTTLHALWMGVPTLTLRGATPAGHTGAAILGHVGLDDFVASDIDDFVARGVAWAGRRDELARLRAGLRQRLAASPLRQPQVIADGVARALRRMWRRWCAGLPAESFSVAGPTEA